MKKAYYFFKTYIIHKKIFNKYKLFLKILWYIYTFYILLFFIIFNIIFVKLCMFEFE